MKTYGLPLSQSRFLIVYLSDDSIITASFFSGFGQQASIVSFERIDEALAWLKNNDRTDLIVCYGQIGLSFLEKVRDHTGNYFPPIILTAKTVTPFLREKAHVLQALEVFSIGADKEKLRFRIDYLIQKKAYFDTATQSVSMDLPKNQIPFWKRFLDVMVSLTVLTIMSPILLVAAILIFIDSPGPVFYCSKRVGRDFKVFNMYKFRSMRPNADKLLTTVSAHNIYNTQKSEIPAGSRCEECQRIDIPCANPLFLRETIICEKEHLRDKKSQATFMKFRNDPRVTRLGSVLRNSSIDELPQLFNILRGDMSLVGNRPLPLYEAERLTTSTYAQRFAAPAGLTGLWQVTKRANSRGVVSDLERIELDIQYAENFSLRTDLNIMFKTLIAVWQKENV